MKITKLGHCCMVIEEQGLRVLTDPGSYTKKQTEVKSIDVIFITHEHADHLHTDSLKTVLQNNPEAKIYTTKTVKELLQKENIVCDVIEEGQRVIEKGIFIEAFGKKHALIYTGVFETENVGFLLADRLFYPGDALTVINKSVELLALPVAGPWIKISEAIDYAKSIKPKICFPVHDAVLVNLGAAHLAPKTVLPASEIDFKILELEKGYEF